jgi:hypothetical protein
MIEPVQVRVGNFNSKIEPHQLIPLRWGNRSILFIPSSKYSHLLARVCISTFVLSIIGAAALTLIALSQRGVNLGKLNILKECGRTITLPLIVGTSVLGATWIGIVTASLLMRNKASNEINRLLSKKIGLDRVPTFNLKQFELDKESGYQICHYRVAYVKQKEILEHTLKGEVIVVRPEIREWRDHYYVLVHDTTQDASPIQNYLHFFEDKSQMTVLKEELDQHGFIKYETLLVEVPLAPKAPLTAPRKNLETSHGGAAVADYPAPFQLIV